jgi:hypothetical protein
MYHCLKPYIPLMQRKYKNLNLNLLRYSLATINDYKIETTMDYYTPAV